MKWRNKRDDIAFNTTFCQKNDYKWKVKHTTTAGQLSSQAAVHLSRPHVTNK